MTKHGKWPEMERYYKGAYLIHISISTGKIANKIAMGNSEVKAEPSRLR